MMIIRSFFKLLFLVLVIACSPDKSNDSESLHKSEEHPDKTYQRIVTLSPHLAEWVYSLNADSRLVATVEYSDYPDAAKSIPRIGNAFQIDYEALAALQPDIILAWEGGNPEKIITRLEEQGYKLIRIPNAELFQLEKQVNQLAEILEVTEIATQKGKEYMENLLQLKNQFSELSPINIFYQISTQPIFTIAGNHNISEMLTICGGSNIFRDVDNLSAPINPESILANNPDVILTTKDIHQEVIEQWDGLIDEKNILAISADEVVRSTFRMAEGAENICQALDQWRQQK